MQFRSFAKLGGDKIAGTIFDRIFDTLSPRGNLITETRRYITGKLLESFTSCIV
jgi:hypothetical protein